MRSVFCYEGLPVSFLFFTFAMAFPYAIYSCCRGRVNLCYFMLLQHKLVGMIFKIFKLPKDRISFFLPAKPGSSGTPLMPNIKLYSLFHKSMVCASPFICQKPVDILIFPVITLIFCVRSRILRQFQ